MISSNERKPIKVQVKFTRSGWRQLARLNRSLGARLIRAFVLRHELSVYLAEHEASGVHLDTECQEVRYVDGVYLLLRRSQGIWYIMDVFAAEEGDGYTHPRRCGRRHDGCRVGQRCGDGRRQSGGCTEYCTANSLAVGAREARW